jgi:large subunit ribosomal protein L15
MANELSSLKPQKGERRPKFRVGRGNGSGNGKTAGRGTKGAQARAGYNLRANFEGGQMPMHRRLPKTGFSNLFAKEYSEVNVGRLAVFAAGTTVTEELLLERGLVSRIAKDGVKVLGGGDLGVALHVRVSKLTGSAAAKITGAGGTVESAAT